MSIQAIAADANSTAVNQGGQLTLEQQRRLSDLVKAESSPGLIGAAGFAFLFGLILWFGSQSETASMSLRAELLFGGLFGLAALSFALLFWRCWRRLQEVRAGHLLRADGHILWQGGAYRAQVPGHTLNLSAFNLGAGTYEFSFLPRSGRVIAAELVARDSPAQAQDELRHALAVANHFNVDDLPAYRAGGLGKAGPRRLRRTWSGTGWTLLTALVALVIFAILVNADVSKDLAPFLFFVAVFAGLAGLFSAVGAISPTLDVLGGKVTSAEGVVQKTIRQTHGRGARTYYYYKLSNQSWLVSPEAYRALIEGQNYRAYFLPRSKQLLAVEPLLEG